MVKMSSGKNDEEVKDQAKDSDKQCEACSQP